MGQWQPCARVWASGHRRTSPGGQGLAASCQLYKLCSSNSQPVPIRAHVLPRPVGLSTQKAAGASATWGRQGGAGRGRAASDSRPVALPPGGAGLSHPVRHPGVLAAPAVPSPLLLVELVLPGRRVCQCAHLCPAPAWPEHMAQARWWFCAGRARACFKWSQPLRSCVLSPQELPGSPTLGACVCWERRKFRQGPCTQFFIFPQD